MSANMHLMSLPDVMIENILSYLSYDEIAKLRLVSRSFNNLCSKMLNRGFTMMENKHLLTLRRVKARLPRRESERRYHPLSRHCDILTSIETRISMLNMTYMKYINHGLCCFIPGKVIDEIFRILKIVESPKSLPRAHEVLQELRDISSMAIEHFDDKIARSFRMTLDRSMYVGRTGSLISPLASISRQEFEQLRRRSVYNAKLSLHLATQYKNTLKLMQEYKKMALKSRRTVMGLTKKQRDQELIIARLKKRIEACDVKLLEITEGEGEKAITASTSSSPPLRNFGSQIKLDLSMLPIGTDKMTPQENMSNMKPRKSVIRKRSISETDTQSPAKVPQLSDYTQMSGSSSAPPLVAKPGPSSQAPIVSSNIESTRARLRELSANIRKLTDKIDVKKTPLSQ